MMRYALIIILLLLSTACPAVGEQVGVREHAMLKKAYEQLQKDSFEACLHTLSPLLDRRLPSSYALSYAALASGGLNQFDQAVGFLTQGTKVYPEKRNFWHNLGVYQMQAENFAGAVLTFERLITMERKAIPPSYYYHLAFALYSLEKYDDTLEALTKITTGRKAKKHHLQLQVHCLIALERWKDSQNTIRRLIRLDPVWPQNWDLLGRIALNQKNYDLACAALEIKDILEETPGTAQTVEHLYRVQSAWNEAARLEGRGDHFIGAQSLFRAGQYEKALLALDGDNTRHMEKSYLRGRLLFALGRNSQAVHSLLEVENVEYLLDPNKKKKKVPGLKEVRRLKDALRARALLLAGQIHWLDQNWIGARDIFKKLELLPGRGNLGKNLAACMQFYLNETEADQEFPTLYDPPLVMAQPD